VPPVTLPDTANAPPAGDFEEEVEEELNPTHPVRRSDKIVTSVTPMTACTAAGMLPS
jgi:hypothetical protein